MNNLKHTFELKTNFERLKKRYQIKCGDICILQGESGPEYWSKSNKLENLQIISSSADRTIKYWNLNDDTCLNTLTASSLAVNCFLILPTGELVLGTCERTIKIFHNNICIKSLIGHTSSVYCISVFKNNFDLIVSGSNDKKIKIWNIRTQECMQTLCGHIFWVSCLLALPNGELVSGSADKTIKVWMHALNDEEIVGECRKTLIGHTSCVSSLILSPKGEEIISSSADQTIKIWSLYDGKCKNTLYGHTSCI